VTHATRLSSSALVLTLALAVPAGAARASDAAHDRHMLMEDVQGAFKPLRAMATKEAPFDAAAVKKNAATIAEKLKAAQALFPEGSGGGESRAKPEIWTDRAAFDKAMKDGVAAAEALAAVGDEAAFAGAMRGLGATCKGCHDKYRLPQK
jgi:cytochrome c556